MVIVETPTLRLTVLGLRMIPGVSRKIQYSRLFIIFRMVKHNVVLFSDIRYVCNLNSNFTFFKHNYAYVLKRHIQLDECCKYHVSKHCTVPFLTIIVIFAASYFFLSTSYVQNITNHTNYFGKHLLGGLQLMKKPSVIRSSKC